MSFACNDCGRIRLISLAFLPEWSLFAIILLLRSNLNRTGVVIWMIFVICLFIVRRFHIVNRTLLWIFDDEWISDYNLLLLPFVDQGELATLFSLHVKFLAVLLLFRFRLLLHCRCAFRILRSNLMIFLFWTAQCIERLLIDQMSWLLSAKGDIVPWFWVLFLLCKLFSLFEKLLKVLCLRIRESIGLEL